MIKVCGTRCVRHHSSLLHFTLGLFGPCHNKSHNGEAGIAGSSCQGYGCPAGPASLLIPAAARELLLLLAEPELPRAALPEHWFALAFEREKQGKTAQQTTSDRKGKGNEMVHVRCWNKDFEIFLSAGLLIYDFVIFLLTVTMVSETVVIIL